MLLDTAVTNVLANLMVEMDDDNTIGFAVGGSYSRGEATEYSDIDFTRFVRKPITDFSRHFYLYRNGYIIEVANIPLEPAWQDLTKPAQAIWFVQALRQLIILQDSSDEIKKLQQAAVDFEWSPLQETANTYSSYMLHERVETIRKIIGKLNDKQAELELQRPTSLLIDLLTHLIAVQRGVLIKTGYTYYQQIYETVGLESAWKVHHLAALGITKEAGSASWTNRAISSLHLYLETASLLKGAIRPPYQDVISYTVNYIEQFLASYL